jgi:hypothetical protein
MKTEQQSTRPTQQEIAAYAYRLWETDGRQHGRDQEYWFQAEAQLTADRKQDALVAKTSKASDSKPVAVSTAPVQNPNPAPTPVSAPVSVTPSVTPPRPVIPQPEVGSKKSRKAKKKFGGK